MYRSLALALAFSLFGPSFTRAGTKDEIESYLPEPGSATLARRIEDVSSRFLGRPYLTGPLGEGAAGAYDRDPLYRFDGFDCTTFVETIMSLSLAKNAAEFETIINRIRYANGVVSFAARNHFPDADWIPNNVRAGFVRDITQDVAGEEGSQTASAVIDKAGWYRKMAASNLSVPGASAQELAELLAKLHSEEQAVPPRTVGIPYISLESIFIAGGGINQELLARIPSGAIGNVVRPNWDLTAAIGTRMNVSHQFLVIRKDGRLLVRQATSVKEKAVVDTDFIDFLRPFLQSSTIRGINLLEVAAP